MTLTIATWNVNSIKARLPNVLEWLGDAKPDIACLQEIKCQDEGFPREEIERLGYNIETVGQKSYNGVALLSRFPVEEVAERALPGGNGEEEQARYIEAVISAPNGPVRVASIYLPNGNPAPGPKYDYKLEWMARLHAHAAKLLSYEEPLVLAGDYNVIPRDADVHDPAAWEGDALTLPASRDAFFALQWLGFTEAFQHLDGRAHQYTFWDYQAGAWQKNNGIRIDHLLCSPQAADRLKSIEIHKDVRGKEKASDHVPVVGTFDL
ncbi:MAG TPA: exodeoxyribonuclease III [Oceanicaulis sp.]|jgi:exodeoxyribonuclease-3|uniref:Exodeoxyribonuclease III n=1 Tax=Glycocaulis albus TaxID=1382801 RepID=A0ABQ1Y076_9PROT|nr:exodeoxyribonuclease III [Glycocaulis albus]MBV5258015.1 exodeoxyribonuclease III [Synechococcus moorigangaii CMS01]GGH08592.1 exodeoxyribonuclease III [Glycocaulis albus]HCY56921.1 exodeoxyribonuclease III [Oceanicaulis sp.]